MPFTDVRKLANEISKRLIAEGKLIEAGFASLRLLAMDKNAPPDQVREMRAAFFAGAQHLFGTIATVLDPGQEPTEADLKTMDQIHGELAAFMDDFETQHGLRPRRDS
jgi:hypothetical protein